MSTIAGNTYSTPKNINLKQGLLRFNKSKTSNPLSNDSIGWGLYVNSSDELVYWDGTNASAVATTGVATTFGSTLTVTGLLTLTAGIDAKVIFAGTETIAAGGTTTALDVTKTVHDIDADVGGDIFTLANGTVGQLAMIVLKTATGVATITPASFLGGTSVTVAAAGASVCFQYTANGWYIVGGNAYTIV